LADKFIKKMMAVRGIILGHKNQGTKSSESVSIGAYFNVLRVLGLQDDFLKLAVDDVFGRKLQDLELLAKKK
jgi:hypothetical protein